MLNGILYFLTSIQRVLIVPIFLSFIHYIMRVADFETTQLDEAIVKL